MASALILIVSSILVVFLWLQVQYQADNKRSFFQAVAFAVFWLVALLVAGRSGLFSNFDKFPSPFMFFFPCLILVSVFLGFSKFGTVVIQNVTLGNLVFFHSFRILAEVVLYLALTEGRAPVQMTFEGFNFDIITGVVAFFLGLYLRKKSAPRLALVFNIMGLVFLAVIAFIAMTSMPTPLRVFMNEPSNIWVTTWPYILLPGVLVLAAITGHFMIFRKLKSLAVL